MPLPRDGVAKAKGIGLAEWTVPFLELSEEARERKAFPLPKRLPALSKEDTTQSISAFIRGDLAITGYQARHLGCFDSCFRVLEDPPIAPASGGKSQNVGLDRIPCATRIAKALV